MASKKRKADTQHNGKGFIAVIYPNTEIPSLEGCPDYESMVERITSKHAKLNGGAGGGGNKCFSFLKGTCARGDKPTSTTTRPMTVILSVSGGTQSACNHQD
eukprot:gene24030-30326_t